MEPSAPTRDDRPRDRRPVATPGSGSWRARSPWPRSPAWVVRPDCGGLVLFSGTARDHAEGRPGVHRLDYEAYEEHVEPALLAVAERGPRTVAGRRPHRAAPPHRRGADRRVGRGGRRVGAAPSPRRSRPPGSASTRSSRRSPSGSARRGRAARWRARRELGAGRGMSAVVFLLLALVIIVVGRSPCPPAAHAELADAGIEGFRREMRRRRRSIGHGDRAQRPAGTHRLGVRRTSSASDARRACRGVRHRPARPRRRSAGAARPVEGER